MAQAHDSQAGRISPRQFREAEGVEDWSANARSKVGATTTAQLVWILASRLAEPEEAANADDGRLGPR